MDPLRIVVLVVHISAAAMLLGAPIGLSRNLKASLKLNREAFGLAATDAAKRGALAGMSSLLTLATGLVLIFMAGGMGQVPINFHMALGLMLIAMVISAVLLRPTTGKLVALAQANPVDQDAARGLIKKLSMGSGILHLLWMINLTLMLVRIYK